MRATAWIPIALVAGTGLLLGACTKKSAEPAGELIPMVPGHQAPVPARGLDGPFGFDEAFFAWPAETGIRTLEGDPERGDEFLLWFQDIGPFALDEEEMAKVSMRVAIRDADGAIVHEETSPAALKTRAARPYLSLAASIPTREDWKQGSYTVRVEIRDERAAVESVHEETFTLQR